MNAKKVVGFLLCQSAFTRRNISSMALVAIFFAVYLLAGGKVSTTLPQLKNAAGLAPGNYGLRQMPGNEAQDSHSALSDTQSKEILGITTSKERQEQDEKQVNRYRAFDPEETKAAEKEKVDSEGLVKGSLPTNRRERWAMEQNQQKPTDALDEIQKRLGKRSSITY